MEIFHNPAHTKSGRHLIRRRDHQLQRNPIRVIVPGVLKTDYGAAVKAARGGGLGPLR